VSAVDPNVKLANINPIKIGNALNIFVAPYTIKSVIRSRDGSLLITASDDFQYRRIMSMRKLSTYDVKVSQPLSYPTGLLGMIT